MEPIQLVMLVAFSFIAVGCAWIWIKEATELRQYWKRR